MNLLILNASPKKKGGASRFLSGLFRLFLTGVRKKTLSLSSRQDIQPALELFPTMDVVCLSVPLYVDGLPSHVVEFLLQAEEYCKNHSCRFCLYALSNNGFVEGKQNQPALHMLQAWCKRAGIILFQMAISLFTAGVVPSGAWHSLAIQTVTWLFLNSGVLFCMARLSSAIRRKRRLSDQFTRVMIPSFLFVPIADVFMILSSLFQGRFLFTLLKQEKWQNRRSTRKMQ